MYSLQFSGSQRFLFFHRDYSKNCTQTNGGLTLPSSPEQQTDVIAVYDSVMRVNRPVRCLLFISLRSRHPHPQTHSIKLGCYGIGTTVATPTHCCHQLQIESLNLIHPLATPLKLPFKLFEALYHLGTIFGHQLKWRSWWFSRGIMWPYPIPQLLLDNSHASSPHGVYSHKNNVKNSFLVRCNHWVLHSGCDPIFCHNVQAV